MSHIPGLPPGVDLSMIPAGVPPPGEVPELGGGESQETVIWAIGIIFPVFALIFVASRIWVNALVQERKFGWDDYTCVVGFLCGIGHAGLMISLRKYARHGWDLPLAWLAESDYMKRVSSMSILGFFALIFSKSSLLFLFLRIFSPKPMVRYTIISMIVFVAIFYGYAVILQAVYCMPRTGQPWDISIGANCSATITNGIVQGLGNIFIDIFVLVLPLSVVLRLKLRRERKIAISAIFFTGIIAFIASVTSLVYKIELFQHKDDDPSFYDFPALVCQVVEVMSTIACACMPSLAQSPTAWRRTMRSLSSLRSHLSRKSSHSGIDDSVGSQTVEKVPSAGQRSRRNQNDGEPPVYTAASYLELYSDGRPKPGTETRVESIAPADNVGPAHGIRKETSVQQVYSAA